ncbi:hypothetical protein SKAU_G00077020 [Synaphobranchus kaupii]|uniref:Uncharacterized protein n=1 Tax=Synaphobranchus kaupii TaxID=118154 RepID=A0A9Q1G7W2_SYNKA|nr:hypothetical protein SKAU_G00077020 [Synaphobranchus kaupii]
MRAPAETGCWGPASCLRTPRPSPPPPPPTEISLLELPPKPERFHVNELEIWPSVVPATAAASLPPKDPSPPPPPAEESPPTSPPSHTKEGPPLPTKPKPKLADDITEKTVNDR